MRRSSSSRAVGVVIVSAWIPPAFECTPRSRGQSDIVPLSISISAVCTISCRNTLYMFRFLPKATDTTVGPSRREGDGNFCEYPGEIQEDDGGIGAEANRNGSDPLGRSPVRGRSGSPSAHHDPFDVAGPGDRILRVRWDPVAADGGPRTEPVVRGRVRNHLARGAVAGDRRKELPDPLQGGILPRAARRQPSRLPQRSVSHPNRFVWHDA